LPAMACARYSVFKEPSDYFSNVQTTSIILYGRLVKDFFIFFSKFTKQT